MNVVLGSVVADITDANLTVASGVSVTAEDSSDIWAIGGAARLRRPDRGRHRVRRQHPGDCRFPRPDRCDVSDSTISIADGTLAVQAVDADPATDVFGTSADPRIIAFTGSAGAQLE